MSLGRLWIFLAIALPTLAALLASLQSVDLTYHIRAGGEILDRGAIPMSDSWTFTAPGDPWTDQQWGAQVLLTGVYRLAGWTGLVILRSLLVGAIYGCLFAIARRQGVDARRAAWLILGAFVISAAALALRPQLLGMSLFALVAFLIVDRRSHPNRLWAIPAIVLVWANVHGSFVLAPLVLGLAWLEDMHDRQPGAHRLLILAVGAAVAACVTPFGPAVWAYAVGLSVNPEVTRRITEWQPTTIQDIPGLLFFGSALAVVVLLARRDRPVPWPTLVGIGTFFLIGVYAARGIAWWPIGAMAGVAGLLAADPRDRADRLLRQDSNAIRRLNVAVAGAILALGVATLPVWRPIDPGTLAPAGVVANAPSGITLALRGLANPGDRLLNPQVWGSWFEFALPALPVAIDSRIEFFPLAVWDAYDTVRNSDDPAQQLERWGVTVAVVAVDERPLLDRLTGIGWQTVYRDDEGWIAVSPNR